MTCDVPTPTRDEHNRRAGEKHDAQFINTVMNSIIGSNMDLISIQSRAFAIGIVIYSLWDLRPPLASKL